MVNFRNYRDLALAVAEKLFINATKVHRGHARFLLMHTSLKALPTLSASLLLNKLKIRKKNSLLTLLRKRDIIFFSV
jgi:hypothetical protein